MSKAERPGNLLQQEEMSSHEHSAVLRSLLDRLSIVPEAVRPDLLALAFVDISSNAQDNNEKLEFLGDAALRLAAAEYLMATYPEMPVGELSAVRSQLVSDRTLATLAQHYNLRRYLVLSKSAAGDKAGMASRLADTCEALMGALYASAGDLSLIRPWLDPHLSELTQQLRTDPARQNYKAALQELTQRHHKSLPHYEVVEISQIHGDLERFEAVVWFQAREWGRGKGRSRKLAEQSAAQIAFVAMTQAIGDGRAS